MELARNKRAPWTQWAQRGIRGAKFKSLNPSKTSFKVVLEVLLEVLEVVLEVLDLSWRPWGQKSHVLKMQCIK